MDSKIDVMKTHLRNIKLITIFMITPFLYSVYWEMENKFEMVACIILMAFFITEVILYLNNNMFKLYLKIKDNGKEYSNPIINAIVFIFFMVLTYFLFFFLIFEHYNFKSILLVYTTTRAFAHKFARSTVISNNYIVSGYNTYLKKSLKSFMIAEKNIIECTVADCEDTDTITSEVKEIELKTETIKIKISARIIDDVYEALTNRYLDPVEESPSILPHFQKFGLTIFQLVYSSFIFIPILIQSEAWFNKNNGADSDFLYIAIFVYVLVCSLIILGLERKFFLASITSHELGHKKGKIGAFYWFILLASLILLNLYFFTSVYNEIYIHLSNLGLFIFLIKLFVSNLSISSSHKYAQEL